MTKTKVAVRRRRDAAASQASILEGAVRVFADKGPEGASMRDLARAAGVSQGLLHHHFGSKRELWEEVKRHAVRKYAERQQPQIAAVEIDARWVHDALRGFFELYRDNPDLQRLGQWAQVKGEDERWEGEDEVFAPIFRGAQEAQRQGLVRTDVALPFIFLAFGGMIYWWFMNKARLRPSLGLDPADPDLDERVFAAACQIVGASPSPPPAKSRERRK